MKEKIEAFTKKIHPIYVLLNWTWWDIGVPTEKDLAKELTKLVENVKDDCSYSATGGLFCGIDTDGIGQKRIGFVLEEYLPFN